jgi:hypothetical protein
LERALGLDIMIEAYASLHRGLALKLAPEEAVAGIIPPHKLKYLPLLLKLIESESSAS